MTRPVRRRGYVLLVTLGLLVLASTLLVAIARGATRKAAEAQLAQQRSQRQWAIESARRAVLPRAEQILSTIEQAENRAAPAVSVDVRLGELRVTLVVADEQAKANVNAMLSAGTLTSVEERLRKNLSGTSAFAHVRLRPGPDDLTRPPPTPDGPPALLPLSGFGQVFDDVSVLMPAAGASPLDSLTLWGDGALNVMRADRATMRTVFVPAMSTVQIDRMTKARDEAMSARLDRKTQQPAALVVGDAVNRLLQQSGAGPDVRRKVGLTTRSACHSLRVRVNDGRRVWYDTTVLDASKPLRPQTHRIAW